MLETAHRLMYPSAEGGGAAAAMVTTHTQPHTQYNHDSASGSIELLPLQEAESTSGRHLRKRGREGDGEEQHPAKRSQGPPSSSV